MTRVYLLRHAESAPSREVDEADWPLSERGRQQAELLVAQLQTLGITRVISSPYLRAIDTVRPFARAAELDVEIDERLHERILSDGFVDDFLALVERSWQDFDFHMPRGESLLQCQLRMMVAVNDYFARSHETGHTFLLGSHGNAIGLCLADIDPASFGFAQWRAMGNPDLFAVDEIDSKKIPQLQLVTSGLRWRRVPLTLEDSTLTGSK